MKKKSKAFHEVKHLNRAVLLLSIFLYFQFLFAQGLEVKGRVANVAGESLASVNVVDFSTTDEVITDANRMLKTYACLVNRFGELYLFNYLI
ncbi:MAG: hypothetical protein LBD80_06040 [Tannerella sp.]|jgi:hypothetical protein|nr:hypothetical protein [Tannerella sp.]